MVMDDKKIRPNEPDLLQSTRAVYEEFLSDLSEEQKCETVNDVNVGANVAVICVISIAQSRRNQQCYPIDQFAIQGLGV